LTPDQPPDDKLPLDPTEDTDMSKHPVIRLHLLLLAAMLLLGSIARAQDYLADPNLPSPKHWEGPTEAKPGAAEAGTQIAMVYPSREEVEDALTRARFLRDVSRDFEGAAGELNQLWLRVNFYNGFDPKYGKFEGALTLYTKNIDDVMRARVELLQATGQFQRAAELAAYPYFHVADSFANGQRIAGMGEQLSRAVLERAFSSWWEAKRIELDAILGQEPAARLGALSKEQEAYVTEHFGRSSAELAARVGKAVSQGDFSVIGSLGLRATPALAELILIDLEGTQFALEVDPLYALATVDPSGACRLASDYFDAGGQSFRLRVLHMVEACRPFSDSNAVWDYPAPYQNGNQILSHPPRCQVPFWIDLIAKLASDRRTRARVFSLVDEIATRDALTPAMQQSLIAALKGSDERDALNVLANLDTGAPISSVKPVLEAAMQHTSAKVRLAAAQGLLNFAESAALLAAAQDSEVEIRRIVARSFVGRMVPRPNYDNPRTGTQSFTMSVSPQVDQQRSSALSRLLEDSDEEVRTIAAEALPQQDWNFSSGAPYLAAARTNDPDVTGFLLRASYPSNQVQGEVLQTIWSSPSKQVLAELDMFLYDKADWRTRPEVWGPALLARATDPKTPFLSSSDLGRRNSTGTVEPIEAIERIVKAHLNRTVDGTILALKLATQLREVQLLATALLSSTSFADEALASFPVDEVANMTELALGSSHDPSRMLNALQRTIKGLDWSGASPNRFFALVQNQSIDQLLRIRLAYSLAEGNAPGTLNFLFETLQEEELGSGQILYTAALPFLDHGSLDEIETFANQALALSDSNPSFALALGAGLGLESVYPEKFAAAVLNPALHYAYSKTEIAVAEGISICGTALHLLMQDSEWSEGDQELLEEAISAPHRQLYLPAIQFAQRMQNERNIPVLGSFLRSSTDQEKQHALVTALGSYMSRDAGQELVQCLGAAADPNVRGAIQIQLSQIREYLEEAEYWAGKEQKRATTDNAVLELVSMLDDADPKIRVAALDGLASFGAKEHLPRIIRMLNDQSNPVQRAAKKAVLLLQNGVSSLDEGDE
jgi:HEAT repeat protein